MPDKGAGKEKWSITRRLFVVNPVKTLHNIAAFWLYEYWALRKWKGQEGKGFVRDWSIAHREGKQSVNRCCGFRDGLQDISSCLVW